jgi:archaellum biogenesis ATPase FlaH
MSFTEIYKLRTNPFRMTPATSPHEIIWAGFSAIKNRLENRIKKSIKIPNSSLVLNWGEYGSGKTHAARYFNKRIVLEDIAEEAEASIPYSIVMPLPKGKEPVYNIFTNVVDKLNIEEIRVNFKKLKLDVNPLIDNFTDNLQIQSVLKSIFNETIENTGLLKKYLYGTLSAAELKELNPHGILRLLNNDSDYTKLLAGLFTCLTYQKKVYSVIIIWFDEFEDLAILNSSNIDKTNNFLREILDNTSNNLLIFLNLTQSALFGVEDLGEYINESVRSRIKERNNFELPSKETFLNYLLELLKIYRTEKDVDPFFPFNEGVTNEVMEALGNVSLRSFNEAFSLLLELADLEHHTCPITQEFFKKHKDEIIGWKG